MKFEVTYSFNVRRFIKHTIEANDLEQAKQMARDQAQDHITKEITAIEDRDGFGSVAGIDASVYMDITDEELGQTEEVMCEDLPDVE